MKRIIAQAIALLLLFSAVSCGTQEATRTPDPTPIASPSEPVNTTEPNVESPEGGMPIMEKNLQLSIDGTVVSVAWEDNASVDALKALVSSGPLTIELSMYGGFEQVGSLGTRLPSSDRETVTQAGDIVLYASDRIVIFYGSNAWSYTRLGKVTDRTAAEMEELLGNGDVTITISMQETISGKA